MDGILKGFLTVFTENSLVVSLVMIALSLLVAGDVFWIHIKTRRVGSIVLTRKRRAMWYSGAILASLLLLISMWAYQNPGLAALEGNGRSIPRLSDWDKYADLLTVSTTPIDASNNKVPVDTLEIISDKLLGRSITRLDSALVYIGLRQYEEAIEYFDLELERVAKNGNQPHLIPKILYFRAIANVLVGKDSIALGDINKAIATDSTYAEAWINRAFLLLRFERFDDAQYSSDMALRFAKDHTWSCVLGVSYLAYGDWHRAGIYFDSAIAKDPMYAEAHAGKSVVDAWLQNSKKSEAGIDMILAKNGSDAVAWTQKANALGLRRDANGVFESLRHASENLKNVKRTRDSASVEWGSAAALLKLGLDDSALTEFSRVAIKYGVNSPDAWYHLARLQANNPDDTNIWHKALESVDSAIFFDPKSGDAWGLRGILMKKLNYTLLAIDSCLDMAFGLDSMRNLSEAWLKRGRTLYEIGEADEAGSAFIRAFEESKDNPRLGYRIALELEGVDSLRAALQSVNQALLVEPTWVEALTLKEQIANTLAGRAGTSGSGGFRTIY